MLLQYIGAVDPAARRSGLSQRGYGRVLVLQRRKQLNYAVRTVGYSVGGATVTWPVAARTPTPIGRAGKLYRVAVLPPIGSRFTRVMKSRHFTAMSPSRGGAEPATTPFSARGTRRSAPGKRPARPSPSSAVRATTPLGWASWPPISRPSARKCWQNFFLQPRSGGALRSQRAPPMHYDLKV